MRKIYIVISALLFLFVSVYGWLAFRDHKSYRNVLPKEAHLIIKLDVDKLIRKGIFYKITHPSNLFSAKSDSGEKVDRPKNGLSIPSNIFFFTQKNDPDRIYATVPVENIDNAVEYFKKIMKIETGSISEGVWSGQASNKRSEVVINDERVLISYSANKQLQKGSTYSLMTSLMSQTLDESVINSLRNTTGDISVLFEGLEVNVSVEGSTIRLSAQSSNLDFNPVNIPLLGPFLENNWNRDLEQMLSESIQTYLQLKGVIQHTDTITTYEFNDNFEKIEQMAFETYPIPGISLYLKTKPFSENQKAVNLLNKNGLKLITNQSSVLHFSNTDVVNSSFSDSNYIFRLEVDFESFVSEINTLKELKFMNSIKSLEFIVIESEDGGYVYEASLFTKENVIGLLIDKL